MPRYIDADIAENMLFDGYEISDVPTADVQEVRHGKWIVCGMFDDFIKCSECEKHGIAKSKPMSLFEMGFPKWCEDCGARMDGDRK